MSVILCSGNCGALMPATTLPASVRKASVATSRPVGVSRGICHAPISGAASAGVSGAEPPFAPAGAGAVAVAFAAGGVLGLFPARSAVAARAGPLVTIMATNKYVGILRSMKVLLERLYRGPTPCPGDQDDERCHENEGD